jgi:hypothetical protein
MIYTDHNGDSSARANNGFASCRWEIRAGLYGTPDMAGECTDAAEISVPPSPINSWYFHTPTLFAEEDEPLSKMT